MAWVRRVRTASGATAVQIAESVAGRRRIVRHVGSARDEVELGLLMAEARRLLAADAQGVLDLGLSLPTARVAMVPAPATALFEAQTAAGSRRPVVAAPRVLGTSSALLYEVLAGVYDQLGFDALADEVFRDLVIARVVEPTSLLSDRRAPESSSGSAPSASRCRGSSP